MVIEAKRVNEFKSLAEMVQRSRPITHISYGANLGEGGAGGRGVSQASIKRAEQVRLSTVLSTIGGMVKETRADDTDVWVIEVGQVRRTVRVNEARRLWFDARAKHGGRGVIALVMWVFAVDFKQAVRRLEKMGVGA